MQQEITRLSTELATSSSNLTKLRDDSEADKAALQTTNQDLSHQLESVNTQLSNTRTELDTCSKQSAVDVNTITGLRKEVVSNKEEMAKSQVTMKESLEKCRTDTALKIEEIQKSHKNLSEIMKREHGAKLNKCKDQHTKLEEELMEAKRIHKTLEDKMAMLVQTTSDKDAMRTLLQKRLDDSGAKLEKISSEKVALEKQIEEMKVKYEADHAEAQRLSQEALENAKQYGYDLLAKLIKSKDEIATLKSLLDKK